MKNLIKKIKEISLVKQIIIGLIVGGILALTIPEKGKPIIILGSLFVGALKSVAPILVFVLVMSAIAQHKKGNKTNMKHVIFLYLMGTLLAALSGVIASFLFPIKLSLTAGVQNISAPGGITEVIKNLLMNIVQNPIKALEEANYIGILSWASILGFTLKSAKESTKNMLNDLSEGVAKVVKIIISFAPLGIMALVFETISVNGLEAFVSYGKLILVLVGTMLFVAFVVNPLIVYLNLRENPYPLVLKCLKESGITAFFTRSSAANIPINMALCERLGLDKDGYSVSIPLGATINMAGAAVTISVLSLAAAHTLNVEVDLLTAFILSLLAAISACGASGVSGGSLLLIPLACSLFGIPNEIAMQVVGVGFIIGVIQDSCETAINSSTDVLFTATAEFYNRKKLGKEIKNNNINNIL